MGGFYWAVICASTALDALFSVVLVLAVSLGDSLYGAVICASAAADASITNYICHVFFLLL